MNLTSSLFFLFQLIGSFNRAVNLVDKIVCRRLVPHLLITRLLIAFVDRYKFVYAFQSVEHCAWSCHKLLGI